MPELHPLLQQEQELFLQEIPGRNELCDGNTTGVFANKHLLSLLLASNQRVREGTLREVVGMLQKLSCIHNLIISTHIDGPFDWHKGNVKACEDMLQALQALIDSK